MIPKNKFGVFFRRSDYANVGMRTIIALVDFAVIVGFYWALWITTRAVSLDDRDYWLLFYSCVFAFLYAYLIEMKRRVGSVGNLITLTRVVDLSGGRPSVFTMMVRNVFWIFGPMMLLVDLLWVIGDTSRQMIRDKLSGVYVVRRSAKPDGTGVISYSTWMVMGHTFLFKEIKPTVSEPNGRSSVG